MQIKQAGWSSKWNLKKWEKSHEITSHLIFSYFCTETKPAPLLKRKKKCPCTSYSGNYGLGLVLNTPHINYDPGTAAPLQLMNETDSKALLSSTFPVSFDPSSPDTRHGLLWKWARCALQRLDKRSSWTQRHWGNRLGFTVRISAGPHSVSSLILTQLRRGSTETASQEWVQIICFKQGETTWDLRFKEAVAAYWVKNHTFPVSVETQT